MGLKSAGPIAIQPPPISAKGNSPAWVMQTSSKFTFKGLICFPTPPLSEGDKCHSRVSESGPGLSFWKDQHCKGQFVPKHVGHHFVPGNSQQVPSGMAEPNSASRHRAVCSSGASGDSSVASPFFLATD